MSEPTGSTTLLSPAPSRPRTAPPPPGPRKDPMGVMADVVTSADGALGLVLWRALRDVYLWAGSEPRERAGRAPGPEIAERLAEARERAPDLADAVAVFARLAVAPAQADPAGVAAACHQVYEWARMEHRAELAVLFAEAAATADPASPARANEAGRECKRAALHERSAVWYQRAFQLAVGARDRDDEVAALLGYGNLMQSASRYDEARQLFQRAARRATRTGRRKQAGRAHHDLLSIAAEHGTYAECEHHAFKALELYPARHPRIPYLLHDYAVALLLHGMYSAAMVLLERICLLIQGPESILMLSTLARAAACAGRRERYQQLRQEVLGMVPLGKEMSAPAMANVAEGACACREWEDAARYAGLALETARARRETEMEKLAAAMLRRFEQREPTPPEAEPPPGNRISTLTWLFNARLQQWMAPRQRGGGKVLPPGRGRH